ncbi:alpha/beta hydrolase, partial [Amycolatopsis sp. H20-H5]|uniref:alpha/beta hydrolase n=1 Tax=Amycolatopsis sp. H20-H5 TaxID=3046309 RepID=UPI002DB7CFE6
PLQRALNARGYVVASLDYRLAPAAPWPAQLTDAKCAVRFLRAHAAALRIDPARIGVWGSSAGGQLAALLGTAGPAAGFDVGQYLEQPSAVRAVVDMFGPTDLARLDGADPFTRVVVRLGLGASPATRRTASPVTYLAPGAPPFLILQGEDFVRPQSAAFAERLRVAGVPVTYIPVQGTGHTLDTPTQRPAPEQLTGSVVSFFDQTLR